MSTRVGTWDQPDGSPCISFQTDGSADGARFKPRIELPGDLRVRVERRRHSLPAAGEHRSWNQHGEHLFV